MTFKVVETLENGKKLLSAVPSAWEKDGHLYWPPIKRVSLLQKLLSDVNSRPAAGWSRRACKLKRQGILTFAEAEDEVDRMEEYAGTSSDSCCFINKAETKEKKRKVTQRSSQATLPQLTSTSYNDVALELLSSQQPASADPQQSPSTNEQDQHHQTVLHIQPSLKENLQLCTTELRYEDLNLNINSPLQYLPNEEEYELQEITLSDVFQDMHRNFNLLLDNQQKIIHQLSKQQTTIDHLLESLKSGKCVTNSDTLSKQDDENLVVIETVDELDDLEAKLLSNTNKLTFIKRWSTVCGTSGKKKGGTCSYTLIDKMISRHLLTKCSWGGGTRKQEGIKFAFKKYRNIIQAFYEIIVKADVEFTYTDCEAFFKTVIRNSTRRVDMLDKPVTRMSAGRTRLKKTADKEMKTGTTLASSADADVNLIMLDHEDADGEADDKDDEAPQNANPKIA